VPLGDNLQWVHATASSDAELALLAEHRALELASVEAARSIGLGDVTGSITPGRPADLLVLKVPGYYGLAGAAATAAAGGDRSHIVSMTVFVTDIRLGPAFTKVRAEFFGGSFPTSALIGVSALMPDGALVEGQGWAYLPEG